MKFDNLCKIILNEADVDLGQGVDATSTAPEASPTAPVGEPVESTLPEDEEADFQVWLATKYKDDPKGQALVLNNKSARAKAEMEFHSDLSKAEGKLGGTMMDTGLEDQEQGAYQQDVDKTASRLPGVQDYLKGMKASEEF